MRKSLSGRVFGIFNYTFFALFSMSIIYPFIYLISISLSDPQGLNVGRMMFYPHKFSLESYKMILNDKMLYWGYFNTIYRTVTGVVLSLTILLCAAYPLSKKDLPHRNFYTSIFVFTMFFGGGLIPKYLLIKNLGLVDHRMVLVIPGLISVYNMLIIRNFLMSIPKELEESARIDGASEWKILFSIIIPLSLPVIATVGLWIAVGHWNSWYDSMIYINSPEKQVLQIYLRRIVVQSTDEEIRGMLEASNESIGIPAIPETLKAAAIIVTVTPILVVYPFIQKYFVKGVMVGSLKG